MAKVTRINSGIYTVNVGDQHYELERFPDGAWLTFDARREFLQQYATKRDAIAGLEAA